MYAFPCYFLNLPFSVELCQLSILFMKHTALAPCNIVNMIRYFRHDVQIYSYPPCLNHRAMQKLKPLVNNNVISESRYEELSAYSEGIDSLLQLYSAADDLASCAIVVNTFDKLLKHNCRPTKAAAGLIWIAFIILTISMILLILWWVLLPLRRRERKQDASVLPADGSHEKQKTDD